MTDTAIAGKHGFYGSCAPGTAGVLHYSAQETFSVGIFQWESKNNGRGCKRRAVKVRVKAGRLGIRPPQAQRPTKS